MMNTKAPSQEKFSELKSKLIQSLQSSQASMEQAKDCFSAIQGQANSEGCYNQIPESLRQELQITTSSSQSTSNAADSRERSIQILDNWIKSCQSTIGCFEAAVNVEQVKSCLATDSNNASTNLDSNTNGLTEPGDDTNTQLDKEW
jgi:hypothetical protein